MRDLAEIRAQFPALQGETAFVENAGGSQVPHQVIGRVHRYFRDSYVQLGATYAQSERATATVAEAHQRIQTYAGAGDQAGVVLGASTTALCAMLAGCYSVLLRPGDAVVVAENGHEGNVGP